MATLIRNRQIAANRPSPSEAILKIEPHEQIDEIEKRLAGVNCVEINFPGFADGRGFSIAKLLRERCGYKGELRAVGHVVRDHLQPMEAVGFDAFLLKEGEDAQAALEAFSDFPIFQPR